MKKLIYVSFYCLMTVVVNYVGEARSERPDYTKAFQGSTTQVLTIIGFYGAMATMQKMGAFDENSTEKPKKINKHSESLSENNLETDPVDEMFRELERQQKD